MLSPMVKIDRLADAIFTSSFTQPITSAAESGAVDASSTFAGSFSAKGFTGGLWVPEKIAMKRKCRSGPQCTPEDRRASMFCKKHAQPANEDVYQTRLAFETNATRKERNFGGDSEYRTVFLRMHAPHHVMRGVTGMGSAAMDGQRLS